MASCIPDGKSMCWVFMSDVKMAFDCQQRDSLCVSQSSDFIYFIISCDAAGVSVVTYEELFERSQAWSFINMTYCTFKQDFEKRLYIYQTEPDQRSMTKIDNYPDVKSEQRLTVATLP